MADEPFLGEIKLISFNFAPQGWAFCNGQTLPINQNQALFSLLGTTYGGNGQTTFALPNLQTRVPLHVGAGPGLSGRSLGESTGEASHTLTISEMPAHSHVLQATTENATAAPAAGSLLASASNLYTAAANLTPLHGSSLASAGGSQAHQNLQPYLTLNFIIALQGIFPSQN